MTTIARRGARWVASLCLLAALPAWATGAEDVDPPEAAATAEEAPAGDPVPETVPAPTAPVDEEPPVPPEGPVAISPIAEGLSAEFGKGVTLRSKDGRFALTIRGRLQLRFTATVPGTEEHPVDLAFQVRRARLVFLGHLFDRSVQFYIQLGMSPLDMEPDLLVPVRDAVITWTGIRDLNVRVGQMKVPFNRERVISSSALQMVDRSLVNAELNLDRDVGVQVFSNDLGGLDGRLGYQLGVFGGEGRNRWGAGPGLLYVARLQVQPLGRFDDAYTEADLTRDRRLRLSLGGGFGYNHQSRRVRSTHGAFFALPTYDQLHAEGDLMLKVAGFSLQGEVLWRRARPAEKQEEVDGEAVTEAARSGLGWMVQAGYYFPTRHEIALRWAEVRPSTEVPSALSLAREATVALGWYVRDHDLKLQADYTYGFGADVEDGRHVVRVQTQLFF